MKISASIIKKKDLVKNQRTMIKHLELYFWPWLISNLIAAGLVFICARRPMRGATYFGVIFAGAGLFNGFTALTRPEAYVDGYGPLAMLPIYRDFIYGWFSQNATLFMMLVALGQLLVGVGLLVKGGLFRPALIGGMVFLIAIVPLGIGSAFPATLLMAAALFLVYRKFFTNA